MKGIQCLTSNGSQQNLRLITDQGNIPPVFLPFLNSKTLTLFGCSPTSRIQPVTSFDVLGAVHSHDGPSLALHSKGFPAAVLTTEHEITRLARVLSNSISSQGATNPLVVDPYEGVLRTMNHFVPTREIVTDILSHVSFFISDIAAETAAMERILAVSDRIKHNGKLPEQIFPYYCGIGPQAQRRTFCTDANVCGYFIPSIRHGDKVLTRDGTAVFVGVCNCDGDLTPFWHCSGSSHASVWLSGHIGRRIVLGYEKLIPNGPVAHCGLCGSEDVSRYLHPTGQQNLDETRWLNEGLFGVRAGEKIGSFTVLGVGPHSLFPSSKLDLFLQENSSQEIVPLSLTKGLWFIKNKFAETNLL